MNVVNKEEIEKYFITLEYLFSIGITINTKRIKISLNFSIYSKNIKFQYRMVLL